MKGGVRVDIESTPPPFSRTEQVRTSALKVQGLYLGKLDGCKAVL